MATPRLNITEVAENQTNKYLTINAAITKLEASGNDEYVNSSAGTGITLSETQFTSNTVFRVSGGSAAFTLTCPANIGIGTGNARRLFIVANDDTTYTCTVRSSGTGTTVDIRPGGRALVHMNNNNVTLISRTRGGGDPYDVSFYAGGTLAANQVLAHVRFTRAVNMPDDFAGSYAYAGTLPTDGNWVFDIAKNGSSLGTLTITTGGTITFVTTGGASSFAAGDRLTITAPNTPDSTGADIAITLAATLDN